MKVFVFGQGKVGRALARAWKLAGHEVSVRAARKGWPRRPVDADAVLLAVRDGDLPALATRIAETRGIAARAVVFHAAGSKPASVLEPLRAVSRGVAQFHPMISFASPQKPPSLTGGHVHVAGDPAALRVGRTLARALEMTPRTFEHFDPVAYHAAAGLVANGAAALAALGVTLLERAGVPGRDIPKMLGPLLRSVGDNVERLGFPHALTGPVRRGDADAVLRHHALLESKVPEALALYRAAVVAQLPLAEALAEAPPKAYQTLRKATRDWH